MMKIKDIFKYFNPKNLQKEVGGYGYDLKIGNFILTTILIPVLAFIIGYMLKLRMMFIITIIFIFFLCIPSMIVFKFKYLYEQRRFSEIVSYLEQMIYSFKKKEKILSSLEDVRQLANSSMAKTLDKAIEFIEYGKSEKNLYREALSIIEKEYSCSRLKTLHSFLIEIEENGGEYQHSLSILLDDIQQWAKRIRLQQQTRKNLQNKVLISIALAMGTCSSMLFLIPNQYSGMIVDKSIYQIFTTIILVACVFLYIFANKKLTSSYLEDDNDLLGKEEFNKYYKIATKFDIKNARKKGFIKASFMALLIPAALYFNNINILIIILGFIIFFIVYPNIKQKKAIKITVREIEKTYPIWIRNLILHLQTNNVSVALYNSYTSCPEALKYEVAKLINGIQKKPGEIEPYLCFMEDFEGCHDIKSSIKHLYALSEFGSDDLVKQMDYMVSQNQELIEHAEEMQNEDRLANLSTLILAPMVLATSKLILDLWLFFSAFMSYMGNI